MNQEEALEFLRESKEEALEDLRKSLLNAYNKGVTLKEIIYEAQNF